MNADVGTPIDRTEKLLQRLCKEGYLIRNREMDGGEEVIEYIVGPRGKVEVGSGSVAGLVRAVYGKEGGGDRDEGEVERMEREDFEERLGRTLGAHVVRRESGHGDGEEGASQVRENEQVEERGGRRSTRRAEEEDEDDEDDSSDESD
jgi:DNA-binding PadR family transcriptional regulator